MGWTDYTPWGAVYNAAEWLIGTGDNDPTNADRDALRQQVTLANDQGQQASDFANTAQGNYNNMTGQLGQSSDYLRQVMMGQNSVAAEQLRQGLASNVAAQRSFAASAAPQNSAAAARMAMNNAAKMGYGLSGQQAVAGLQERNQAAGQLGNLLLGERGQDASTALGSRQNSINAYGQGASAYGNMIANPQKTTGQQLLNAGVGLASAAMTKSDRRAKHEIEDGDEDANKAIDGLRAYTFAYKDAKDGKGKQFGVMAQDLEKAGLKHAVIDTPKGKYVDGAKAATSSLALVAALGRRVSKLEKGAA